MSDANSSAVVLAGDRGPKDDKARKKKAKVNVQQQQPLYPYKLPVHQPGVDGFYCTYGCGTSRADGGMRRSTSAGSRTSWSGDVGAGSRSRGRIRPVTVMYPEEGFVCCHPGHEPGEEVDEFEGTEYEDEEDADLVVGGEEEEDYGEEYEEYEKEEGK